MFELVISTVAIAEPNRLKIVVIIIYGKLEKLLAESRTMSFSLRRFVALPKIVQADYQPRRPQDKTAQITV